MPSNRNSSADGPPEGDKLLPNSAVDDFFVKMNRQVRRPRPSEEAVAAALQAIQRLAGEVAIGEPQEASDEVPVVEGEPCPKCGGVNAESNRFCGYCGAAVGRMDGSAEKSGVETSPPAAPQPPAPAPGQHIYHHHYHHHYFAPNGSHAAAVFPFMASEPDSSRGAPADAAGAQVALRQLVQDWASQSNAKSVEGLAGLYCVDAILLRPEAKVLRSRASIRQYLQAAIGAGLTDIQLELTDLRMLGTVAYLAGLSRILVPGSGRAQQERTGKFLMLARYESGNWKIFADVWCMNRDPLPAGSESLVQEPDPFPAPAPVQDHRHRYTW